MTAQQHLSIPECNRFPRRLLHLVLYFVALNHPLPKPRLPLWKYACPAYKNTRLKNRLMPFSPTGKALCLLKTQFAKKPKNPV